MKLDSPVAKLPLVGPVYVRRLEKLGIQTVEDLIHHIPHRYNDYSHIAKIAHVQAGETATIRAELKELKNLYTKHGKKIQAGIVSDNSGNMQVIWFNQPFLARNLKKGSHLSLSGKVDFFNRERALLSPDYEYFNPGYQTLHTGRLVPVYPETAQISSKWLRARINYVLQNIGHLEEFLPDFLLKQNNLLDFNTAINSIHFPQKLEDAQKARVRLSFDELLFLQLKNQYKKENWNQNKAIHNLRIDKKIYKEFTNSLPFNLTLSQKKAIGEIFSDLQKETPMNRLLEGDVGSGKTVVAATCAFCSFINGFQSVFMAPTQILANQHYKTLQEIFAKFKVRVTLITSAGVKSDFGKTDIYVGTHALIHKKVNFENVAIVVIVEQRAHLVKKSGKKSHSPHVLTMTATPIPRTIALTFYGDLDLSTLDELPKGRQKITTWIVPPLKREAAYNWIKEQIKKERVQGFIICPLIEESQVESMRQVKAATVEYEKLCKVFANSVKLGLLHGRLKAKEKDTTMDKFRAGDIDILVSTPVVEVGIDVANATLMIIEAAERFGLAQLHQLRGRIGRGKKKSYCLLFTSRKSKTTNQRLKALKENKSGFELAELDLKMRGPGEVFGTRQHGFPELKIASWNDSGVIKLTKKVAEDVIGNKTRYPKLIEKLESKEIILN